MNKTKIEYLTHTWNPLAMRCSPISEGCKNCWHLALADRLAKNPKIPRNRREAYAGGEPVLIQKELSAPAKLKKPAVIGLQFMGDLFHESVHKDYFLKILLVIRKCPQHTFVILTKRPERMAGVIGWSKPAEALADETLKVKSFPDNVIGMATVENQEQADKRIPVLLQSPYAIYGVSVEPMLSKINLRLFDYAKSCDSHSVRRYFIQHVICGTESGPGRRPAKIEWIRNLRDQCVDAHVPFFLKQMEINGKVVKMPELDGKCYDQLPDEE